jgi:hypothetical protein
MASEHPSEVRPIEPRDARGHALIEARFEEERLQVHLGEALRYLVFLRGVGPVQIDEISERAVEQTAIRRCLGELTQCEVRENGVLKLSDISWPVVTLERREDLRREIDRAGSTGEGTRKHLDILWALA